MSIAPRAIPVITMAATILFGVAGAHVARAQSLSAFRPGRCRITVLPVPEPEGHPFRAWIEASWTSRDREPALPGLMAELDWAIDLAPAFGLRLSAGIGSRVIRETSWETRTAYETVGSETLLVARSHHLQTWRAVPAGRCGAAIATRFRVGGGSTIELLLGATFDQTGDIGLPGAQLGAVFQTPHLGGSALRLVGAWRLGKTEEWEISLGVSFLDLVL